VQCTCIAQIAHATSIGPGNNEIRKEHGAFGMDIAFDLDDISRAG
jgi:hypothetical protein